MVLANYSISILRIYKSSNIGNQSLTFNTMKIINYLPIIRYLASSRLTQLNRSVHFIVHAAYAYYNPISNYLSLYHSFAAILFYDICNCQYRTCQTFLLEFLSSRKPISICLMPTPPFPSPMSTCRTMPRQKKRIASPTKVTCWAFP